MMQSDWSKRLLGELSASDSGLTECGFVESGPPGDRTQDTVIKSHVLYH